LKGTTSISKRSPRSKKQSDADVLIVGGGVMGCAAAYRLALAGRRVTVLERSVPGAEASSAAAGILGARVEAHHPGPLADLFKASSALYPALSKELARTTGIDIEYRECGVLRVAFSARELRAKAAEVRFQRGEVKLLSKRGLAELEPGLSPKLAGGLFFAGDARVDPKRLLTALHIAARQAGAEFRSGAYVKRVLTDGDRVRGVALDDGRELLSNVVVLAAGSWTTLVEGSGLPSGKVIPARGQIVFGPSAYLVPRDDGRVLIGSTLEFVGYRRDVTAEAARNLLDAAIAIAPELGAASLSGAWSNFRPYTEDQHPLIGPTRIKGLLLATGHFRNGILLAPVTAEIIHALVLGKTPKVKLFPFDPER
jgi:glycine oxidase